MKEILANGVTGILVSHSIDQIREMCNKILWLDHGNQIIFTDEVDECCDAYEEFLRSKKLPHNKKEIGELAIEHRKIVAKKREEEQKKESEKLQKELQKGDSDAAIQAAIEILRKNCPEMLKE